jgi:hypothetical protein
MENRTECFVKGAPEIYFNKPILRRQHVAARRRPVELQNKLRQNKTITSGRFKMLGRFWRRWFSWFPFPIGDRV